MAQQPKTPPVEEKPASETPQEQPSVETDEPIELVVTGEQDGYRVPNTTTGTRTDTPLRDIPQSIQIIPQQVLRDQRADLGSALLNAPSVRNAAPTNFDSVRIQTRGFFSAPALDGIIPGGFNGARVNVGPDLTGIEKIEVLQGPSSVLFGSSSPGGTVNFITKQPLRDPYYFAEATVGSFNFYRGEIDLSGPLDDDKKVLYRLNASYRDQEFFTELGRTRNLVIAPVVSAALGENTNLSFGGIYKDISFNADFGLPAVGTVLPNPNGRIPRNRMTNEGSTNLVQARIGYTLDHKFSENWSVSNTFRYENIHDVSTGYFPLGLEPDNRTQTRFYFADDGQEHDYKMVTNIIGKFSTGSIQHQLLIGVDLGRYESTSSSQERDAASIDLFNPIFGQLIGTEVTFEDRSRRALDSFGIVLQDQITFAENLKFLISGRFDTFTETNQNLIGNTETSQSLSAFSPRLGIVYQPIARYLSKCYLAAR